MSDYEAMVMKRLEEYYRYCLARVATLNSALLEAERHAIEAKQRLDKMRKAAP